MSKRIFMGFIGAAAFALTLGLSTVSQAGPPTVCGDGLIEGAEICDDGNTVDGDGCSSVTCLPEVCGDGTLENNGAPPDEECDDGNTTDLDGCDSVCACEAGCGNGILTMQCGEVCDDGNTVNGDGCDEFCMDEEVCGNGIVEGAEACDDGNTIAGDGCENDCTESPVVDYMPTKDDSKCVNGINKGWAGVIKATNKVSGKCVKDISKGKVTGTFTDCAVAGDVGKAFDKTTKADQKSCPPAPEMFGYIADPMAVNMSAAGDTLTAHEDLLGSTSNIVLKDDKVNAKCQQEVQKGLIKYLDGLASDANKAKKTCLKGKKGTPCVNGDSLATAMTTDGKKGTKALSSWNTKTGKKCSDVATIAGNFPGACSSSATFTELVACSAVRARCSFCATLNAADGLSVDCDEYASSGNPGSCDPFVPPATTTVSATTTTGSGTTTTSSGTTTTSSGTTTTSGATTTTVAP